MPSVITRLWLAALLAVAILWVPAPSRAQTTGGTIADIRVVGVERIEPSTVISYLRVAPGDAFSEEALNESLKSLFATGLFADVVLSREGDTLVVTVVENPIINQIAFEGNRRLDDEVLLAEVELRPRVVYTRTRVQNDTARIQELYRRSGRFAATVEPKIIELDQNRVDLVFEIDEGPLSGIERISFVGNRAFSDGTLRGEIATQETEWWNILATNDTYDPDRLAFDQEQLRRFYLNEGYADFRVISAVAELAPDGEGFFITITIEEGERYRFGTIDIISAMPNVDVEQLRPLLTTEEGDWYSSKEVDDSIAALTQALGDQQYAFVAVEPAVSRNREEKLIAITYQIGEGPRIFVERIDISGNLRTADEVIRREFELVEGDPFNATLLRRSEARIRNLGFFSQVEVTAEPGSVGDQTIIRTNVTEQSTGDLTLGAGYSTSDGPLGNISLRERNFLGRGQDLRISTSLSGVSSQIDLSFTEPYFLERNLAAGFDIFRITRDNQQFSAYDETSTGFALRMGYPLSDNLRQTVRYRFAVRDVNDVPDGAPLSIRDQEGTTITSSVLQSLTYDQLDSRITPTDGYLLSLSNEVAGLGGDVAFFRTIARADYYYPVTDWLVMNVGVEGGNIVGLDEDVRINDRFFVGGNNFRGFATGGIGPRDICTHDEAEDDDIDCDEGDDDALGGNNYVLGTVELTFPIGLPEEFGIRGRAFTDVGTLWEVDVSGLAAEGVVGRGAELRVSSGLGLSWNSPFGPIRVDYAIPYVKQDFDDVEEFRFSFGTRF